MRACLCTKSCREGRGEREREDQRANVSESAVSHFSLFFDFLLYYPYTGTRRQITCLIVNGVNEKAVVFSSE